MIGRAITTIRHTVVPYMLAARLLSLTSTSSLALLVQVPIINTAYAAAPTQVVQPLSDADFLAATNAARIQYGEPPLHLDAQLENAAMAKAVDMKTNNYWDHFRPSDGKSPWDFIDEAGYHYKVAGENLARGFHSVNAITQAWLNSPAHRANLLSEKYTDVGFADIEGVDQNGQPALLTVQMFGSR